MKPSSPEAYQLVMEGAQALTDVEANGMRIDVDYLNRVIVETGEKIKGIRSSLRKDEVFKTWRKMYGERADLGSPQQLAKVVFGVLGVEAKHFTKTRDKDGNRKPQTSEEALEDVDFPFVRGLIDLKKLEKVRSTFLIGLRKEVVNGFVHPFLHLHLVKTHRSSGSDPNLQNQPIRDERQARLIRRAFIPRDGHVLVEIDYRILEFKGAACFWQDSGMVDYASDTSLDIHRDIAMECFKLPIDQVTKEVRSYAKNQFVFPILYGSYHVNCAAGMWTSIRRANLKTEDGRPLYNYLERKGISRLGGKNDVVRGTFTYYIKEVEENFNRRFRHWSSEKERWWNQYLERGWFRLMTGFVCSGVHSYNQLMNTPIQGPSFHCLLWSLIRINKWLKDHRMKSKVICEVHDSVILDVYRSELEDVVHMCIRIMTQDIRRAWKWIITPLEVEVEMSDVSWFDKKPM